LFVGALEVILGLIYILVKLLDVSKFAPSYNENLSEDLRNVL